MTKRGEILPALSGIILLLLLAGCGGGGGGGSGPVLASGGSNTYSGNDSPIRSATLEWEAPTRRADGEPLTDLAGYKVYYGTAPGDYGWSIDVGNVTAFTLEALSSGTYYFTVTAYDGSGHESAYAEEVSKEV